MFGGKFGFTRFSLLDAVDVMIEVSFGESIYTQIVVDRDTVLAADFGESIYTQITVDKDTVLAADFGESIYTQIAMGKDTYYGRYKLMFGGRFGFTRFSLRDAVDTVKEASFGESISSQIAMGKDTALAANFVENIYVQIAIGKDTILLADFSENIYTQIILAKDTALAVDFCEALFTLIRAVLIEIYKFEINVAIPPDGELRINSEHFEVTLNGASIMHLYSGDWINISRNTLTVDIDKPLNGQLIYLERFL